MNTPLLPAPKQPIALLPEWAGMTKPQRRTIDYVMSNVRRLNRTDSIRCIIRHKISGQFRLKSRNGWSMIVFGSGFTAGHYNSELMREWAVIEEPVIPSRYYGNFKQVKTPDVICLPAPLSKVDRAKVEAYQARRQVRIERLRNRAAKVQREAEGRYSTAKQIMSFIPPGQPILVGHHSERRHRAALRKIDTNMRKSIELDRQAKDLEYRAKGAERNSAIYSDDPEALEKLNAELAQLKATHEQMKAVNKIVRTTDDFEVKREAIMKLGISQQKAEELIIGRRFYGGAGFKGFELTNSNANIRRIEKRIDEISKMKAAPAIAQEHKGLRIEENPEAARIQLFFDGKPPANIIAKLKYHGFRWAPSIGAWQRHLNTAGRYAAECVLKEWQAQ